MLSSAILAIQKGGDSRARGRTSAGDCESQRPAFARALQDVPTYLQSCMQGNFNLQNFWGLKMGYTVIYTLQMAIWNGIMRRVNGISDIKWLFYIILWDILRIINWNWGNLDLSEIGYPKLWPFSWGKVDWGIHDFWGTCPASIFAFYGMVWDKRFNFQGNKWITRLLVPFTLIFGSSLTNTRWWSWSNPEIKSGATVRQLYDIWL